MQVRITRRLSMTPSATRNADTYTCKRRMLCFWTSPSLEMVGLTACTHTSTPSLPLWWRPRGLQEGLARTRQDPGCPPSPGSLSTTTYRSQPRRAVRTFLKTCFFPHLTSRVLLFYLFTFLLFSFFIIHVFHVNFFVFFFSVYFLANLFSSYI